MPMGSAEQLVKVRWLGQLLAQQSPGGCYCRYRCPGLVTHLGDYLAVGCPRPTVKAMPLGWPMNLGLAQVCWSELATVLGLATGSPH